MRPGPPAPCTPQMCEWNPEVMSLLRTIIAGWLQTIALLLLTGTAAAAPTHITAGLTAEGAAAPGQTVTLAVTMKPAKGWHGYWENPGDAGFGMTLDWALPDGAKAGKLLYPVPHRLLIAGLMNHVYEDDYALLVPLTVPADALPGTRLAVRAKAEWLACTDQICVPERADLSTEIAVAAPGSAAPPSPQFDRWRAKLPAPLGSAAAFEVAGGKIRLGIPMPAALPLDDPHVFSLTDKLTDYAAPQEFRRQGNLLVVTLSRPARNAINPQEFYGVLSLDAAGNGVTFAARPGRVPAGGELLGRGPETPGLGWLLLAALAGGLLLNVMPCVFPILSLKALSLARAGESAADARAEGLAYTAGVITACAALGGLLLALRAAGSEVGWAFQLQEPGVVAALLLLSAAITANLMGLFEFSVPGFASSGSPQGAFATGLLAAFVATPCTGPFMAAAMGAALLLPAAAAMALFVAVGLGLALPFLALALVPPLRRMLPRPGAWMNWFRRAMAVPMGLTALALMWLTWRLGGVVFAGIVAALAVALVALLAWTGRTQRRGLPAARVVGIGVLAIAAVGLLVAVPRAAAPGGAEQGLLPSTPFSETALASARASGRPVFAYFTADWCLTCKVNEQVAIERAETRDAFARSGVIVLRGDWTRRDAAITRYLTAHGAGGVPLYVWYGPQGEAQVLPQLLSSELLAGLAGKK